MQKTAFILLLFSFMAKISLAQIPILDEPYKRGIDETFEEFRLNSPTNTDSFYVESIPRTQENWEGTSSLVPRYAENNRKVKRAWGFCDGQNVYVFHQWEFFKVELDSTEVGFYAYKEIDNSGAIAAGVLGGAIGGGIYAAIAVDNAKKKKVYYNINLNNGTFSSDQIVSDLPIEAIQAKIIIYRRDKKQKSDPLSVFINDSTTFVLIPNSIKEFKVPISDKPVKVCYGEGSSPCLEIDVITDATKYLEGSISSKTNETLLEEVNTDVGEFNAKQAKFFQDKRENN